MKINYRGYIFKPIYIILVSIFLIPLQVNFLNAEYLFEELQIDNSTKVEDDGAIIPTNPFEIVEMIRKYNSLNDATKPSDAVNDALDSFNSLEDK